MNTILKNWWILTIKGITTLVFASMAISVQPEVMIIIAKVFGLIVVLSGFGLFLVFLKERKTNIDRNWRITESFIDLIMGLIIISFSGITNSTFLALETIWISFMGILQMTNVYRLRGLYNHYRFLFFNGLLAICFAVIVFTQPINGFITMMILIGLYTVVFGGFLVISSLYIRKIFRDIDTDIPHKIGDEANQELTYY